MEPVEIDGAERDDKVLAEEGSEIGNVEDNCDTTGLASDDSEGVELARDGAEENDEELEKEGSEIGEVQNVCELNTLPNDDVVLETVGDGAETNDVAAEEGGMEIDKVEDGSDVTGLAGDDETDDVELLLETVLLYVSVEEDEAGGRSTSAVPASSLVSSPV